MNLEEITSRITQGLGLSKSFLHRPQELVWPHDEEAIPENIKSALCQIQSQEQKSRYTAFLLAAACISPKRQRLFPLLEPLLQPAVCGLNLTWQQIKRSEWLGIPLVVTGGYDGRIVYAVIGCGLEVQAGVIPSSLDFLDHKALEIVNLAGELADRKEFFFWLPGIFGTRVSGGSIGLPVYLGLRFLGSLSTWPQVVCTGSLGSSGELLPVSGITQKAGVALEHGFSALIHPDDGQVYHLPEGLSIDRIPVPDLDTAQVWAEHFCPDFGQQHLYFYQQRHNISQFLEQVVAFDLKLLHYLENKEAYFRHSVQPVVARDAEQRERVLVRLQEAFKTRQPDLEKMFFLVNHLFPLSVVQEFMAQSPRQAFKSARMHLRLRNHMGILHEVWEWSGVAQRALDLLAAAQDVNHEDVLIGIYRMVGNLQNRYMFTPDHALDISEGYRQTIEELNKRFQARRRNKHCAADEALGKYYGTMAQHYGFCGPEHIQTTLQFCDLAQDAFGNGQYEPMRMDWIRIFSYRFFAFLDAGDLSSARLELENYLDGPVDSLDYEQLGKFEHHHVARYMAEAGQQAADYEDWAWEAFQGGKKIRSEHPWQLWTLNMGRITGQQERQKAFWGKSLSICWGGGPTMQIMGLLPLAYAHQAGLEDSGWARREAERVLEHCRDSGLWVKHFDPLWDLAGKEVLKELIKKPGRYFPLSYR